MVPLQGLQLTDLRVRSYKVLLKILSARFILRTLSDKVPVRVLTNIVLLRVLNHRVFRVFSYRIFLEVLGRCVLSGVVSLLYLRILINSHSVIFFRKDFYPTVVGIGQIFKNLIEQIPYVVITQKKYICIKWENAILKQNLARIS